jgi:putative hydrolase of the HAD superfamily
VLAQLRGHYALGLICNVGIADSTTLRTVLARHGMLDAFQVLTFSDEYGRLKPDPSIFHHTLEQLGWGPAEALHVGDLEELDVEGARAAGMRVARYDYPAFSDRPKPPTQADALFTEWSEFPAVLQQLDGVAREP